MYKLDERRPCKECGKALVYTRGGWFHVRKPRQPHTAVPIEDTPALPEGLQGQRLAELEEVVKVQAARIQTLLEANRELSARLKLR